MTTGDYDVKTTVKAYYGDFVIRAVESDSGDDPLVENEKSAVATYDTTETEGVPPDALAASAGCGNPVALASLKPGRPWSTSAAVGESTASWRHVQSDPKGGSSAST